MFGKDTIHFGFVIFFALFSILLFRTILKELILKEAWTKNSKHSRKREPVTYWIIIFVQCLILIFLIYITIEYAIKNLIHNKLI